MRLAWISVTFFLCVFATSPCFAGQAGAGTTPDVAEAAKIAIERWTKCLGPAVTNGPGATSDEGVADGAFRSCQAAELEMARASIAIYQDTGHVQRVKDDLIKFKADVRAALVKEILMDRTDRTRRLAAYNAHRRWVNCFHDKIRNTTTSAKTTVESGFSACSSEEASFAAIASDDPTERAKIVKAARDKVRLNSEDFLLGR